MGSPLVDISYIESVFAPETFSGDTRTRVLSQIPVISDRVREVCQRNFINSSYTEFLSHKGGKLLWLRNYPVISVTSIHDDVERVYSSSTLIDPSNYVIDQKQGLVTLDGGYSFSAGLHNVKVVYDAGFGADISSLDDSLKMAVSMWVMISVKRIETRQIGTTLVVSEGESINYDYRDPPEEVRSRLARFIKHSARVK